MTFPDYLNWDSASMSDSLSHNVTGASPALSQNYDDIAQLLDELDNLNNLKTPIYEQNDLSNDFTFSDLGSPLMNFKNDFNNNLVESDCFDWDLPSFLADSPCSEVETPFISNKSPNEYCVRPDISCSLDVGSRLTDYFIPRTMNIPLSSSNDMRTPKNPSVRYVKLIAEAILSKEDNRMFLQQIYNYIAEKYTMYSRDARGWKNSVRYNLSLNRCFVKTNLAGKKKGHWWTIHPVCIDAFKVGRFAPYRFPRKRKTLKAGQSKHQPKEAVQMTNTPLPYSSLVQSLSVTGPRDELYAQHQRAIEVIMKQLSIKQELSPISCSCFQIKGHKMI
ncbi:unnamed protein product [Dimorphilus gyrociliatus]|uniref:Fork-head domain-containing protein n=1 Tax=Dimorphilus gyrociliatus TaxID=2664684 RepID=A0A7I8W4T3_9ANNE|nr:unnamed protein product [Dimorphilus gyrociliatus]